MAARQSNEQLAQVIKDLDLTYELIAREFRTVAAEAGESLNTNRSAIAHWVRGGTPTGEGPRYLAEALSRRANRTVTPAEIGLGCEDAGPGLSADPVAAASDLGRADLERRRFLSAAAFTTASVALPLSYDDSSVGRMLRARQPGAAVGAEEIGTIRSVTAALTAADERHGGGHGLTTVTAYLTDTVVPMLDARYPSAALRREAFGAAAELAYLAGWKHHDLGQEEPHSVTTWSATNSPASRTATATARGCCGPSPTRP